MPFQNKIGNLSNCICGLVFYLKDLQISSEEDTIPVPLKSVNVSTKIIDFVSEIKVAQRYVNAESNPIEAVYFFPVEEEAAVISFEAKVDDRKISTKIKEKEQARKDYNDAVQNRKTAVLVEETQPDIFQIKVGHLKPNQEAEITITYVSELPVEDGNIKLTIPTTIAPRYIPSSDQTEAAKQIASIPYSANTPAPLSFNFTGLAQSKVNSIKSPSHEFNINIEDNPNEFGQFNYSGELSIKTSDMDRDIILYVKPHNPEKQNTPVAFLEEPDVQNKNQGFVGMVSLVTNFELEEQLTEMVFLVDRSGSMRRDSMDQAKKALELFLHSLPSDCYFNIWSFGSRYDALFPEGSAKYSDDSLKNALNHVREMSANYGGTEIYSPLRDIFQQARPEKGYLRQVFVLTDGQVSNVASVISLVKQNNAQGRLFSLGIGSSASRHLVKGIARAGCGTSIFANQYEDLRAKVMIQLKNALQPVISNISIIWDDNSVEQESISKDPNKAKKNESLITKQVPFNIPPIFDGTRLLAYYFYPPEANKTTAISIKADLPSGPLTIDVDIAKANMLHHSGIVRKLAARKKIQELEESKIVDEHGSEQNETTEDIKKSIIKLGIENGLASQYTSFVGIDDKTGDTLSEVPIWTREIGNQISLDQRCSLMVSSGALGSMPGLASLVTSGTLSSLHTMAPVPQVGSNSAACNLLVRRHCGSTGVDNAIKEPRSLISARSRIISSSLACASASSREEEKIGGHNSLGASLEFNSGLLSNRSSVPMARSRISRESVKIENKQQPMDKMTELINLQKSNGEFELSSENWAGSILEAYLGNYSDVKSCCPNGININLWITALSMKILEVKMDDRKDLWDLVMQKSHKFLNAELNKINENYENLMNQVEKFVKTK